jgi:hypothetical protein
LFLEIFEGEVLPEVVNCDNDDGQGRVTAEHLHGEYLGLWNITHTGVLVGQRYMESVE